TWRWTDVIGRRWMWAPRRSLVGDALRELQELQPDAAIGDARIGAHQPDRMRRLQQIEFAVEGRRARRGCGGGAVAIGPGVEIGDRHVEHFRDLLQAAGRDAVGAGLVLLHLLERDVEHAAELGLRYAALEAQGPHAFGDFQISW